MQRSVMEQKKIEEAAKSATKSADAAEGPCAAGVDKGPQDFLDTEFSVFPDVDTMKDVCNAVPDWLLGVAHFLAL
eukprot:4416893-Karenia_brevis.AAC.1